jgi:hypothetical protein
MKRALCVLLLGTWQAIWLGAAIDGEKTLRQWVSEELKPQAVPVAVRPSGLETRPAITVVLDPCEAEVAAPVAAEFRSCE